MIRIGIDVGGTNTDAVLIDGDTVCYAVKVATTEPPSAGVSAALARLLAEGGIEAGRIGAVMIGTTQFLNSLLQRRGLTPVAAIRICLPAAARLPPGADWPADLRALVLRRSFMVQGGHEVDGRPLARLDHTALQNAARIIREEGIAAVAITASFSPVSATDEITAAALLRDVCGPEVAITCSHELGGLGLLARENAALLNASLCGVARQSVAALGGAVAAAGIKAQLYITQNDGTIVDGALAASRPVLCLASGPTNSLRGAAFLSGCDEALVVDVGGTTTDLGALQHGFPRAANSIVTVGGVRTLFRMPELASIPLGGGTIVDPADPENIGPVSTGAALMTQARVFGGAVLTATDIAVAAGLADLGDPARLAGLSAQFVAAAMARIHHLIGQSIDHLRIGQAALPLIAVGGAAFLVPDRIEGIGERVAIPRQAVANAVGAALCQVSGAVDQIFRDVDRGAALEQARQTACDRAVAAGANPGTLRVLESEDLPMAYMPGNCVRIRVKVVGDIEAATAA